MVLEPTALKRHLAERARPVASGILDGEIVCLGPDGRALFETLLCRRAEPYLYAFDCLWLHGCDLRDRPLIERKRILRGIVLAAHPRVTEPVAPSATLTAQSAACRPTI
ncbi:MAG: hypothetical protein AAB654_03345, partial [Acidobacteriota bacterium]